MVNIELNGAVLLALMTIIFSLGVWVANVNADRKDFKKLIKKLDEKIGMLGEKIGMILDYLLGLRDSPVITHKSPLRLTELGEQISENIGAEEWAESEADTLLDEAKDKDRFEIQTMAFDHASGFEPPQELFAKMKDNAFDNGLDLDVVRRVLGVVLRDRILNKCALQPPSLDDRQDQE